jgi:hypothetical protein
MPGLTWGQPPFYASQMAYTNYLSTAVPITATPIAPPEPGGGEPGYKNLTAFALSDERSGALVLRFVNDNNRTVLAQLEITGGRSSQTVAVQTLRSPLFGTPLYDEQRGGWNSPANTTFVATANSSWQWRRTAQGDEQRVYEIPPSSFVVLRWDSA